jgi:hypothetical protein
LQECWPMTVPPPNSSLWVGIHSPVSEGIWEWRSHCFFYWRIFAKFRPENVYDFVLCKGFFTKAKKKDPSSPDFEFFIYLFLIARFFNDKFL